MQAEAKKFYGMADKETDPNEKIALKKQGDYYDKRQLIEKIKLNSAYGSLSNPASKWYNSMIGQSTTLSGRMIVRHMGAKINEIITGDYNYLGKSIIYGDSVTGDTLIRTDGGEITIEQLYKESVEHCIADGKEYGLWSQAKVIGFNAHDMEPVISQIEYVMRHKTKKKLYRITTENGKQITVTEDHSVMIDRDGFLIEVKPTDIQASDGIITLRSLEAEWTVISTIENLGEVDDYVYDISIKNGDPMFFGNDILVHNTDSQYFSAYPTMKDDPEFADFGWAKEDIITLYDQIADLTNESFPEFMKKSFNVPLKRGEVIRAGREICASRGLFITKKRYAVMIFDKEGKRKDVDGKSGEIKAMGLDLKRSDTNLKVQKFLMDVLVAVLHDKSQDEIFDIIKSFRKEIKENWMPWEYGTPKRVNNMSKFLAITQRATKVDVFGGGDKGKKSMIPGHVLAALSWNRLRDIHHDNEAMKIQDGQKTVVCRLRNNPYGFTAIAYPIDQLILPEWFTTLPFDTDLMEEKIVDNKIGNLLDVLEWDLTKSKINGVFDELFTF
jgi:DNA polymerase elongation subunit (family B)